MYPHLCSLMNLITPSDQPHPLGNRHQAHNSTKKIHEANLESVQENLRMDLNSNISATKACPQITISADKGTAPKDVTRQAVVATYIGANGLPNEKILGVPQIKKGDAQSTADNLKTTITRFVDPRNVAFITTDSAAYYVGRHSGMIERIKNDSSFGTVHGLPDFCHKTERLMDSTVPAWVRETLDVTRIIGSFINEHPSIKNQIHEFVNIVEGYVFVDIPTTCDTQFAQYLHLHLDAVLTNIKVLLSALPSIEVNTVIDEKKKYILKHISCPIFVARVMLIKKVYGEISLLEKAAQGETFGPFQYMNLIEKLRKLLKTSKLSKDIESLVNTGIFEYNFNEKLVTEFQGINLRKSGLPKLPKRNENEVTQLDILMELKSWFTDIESKLDQYLSITYIPIVNCYTYIELLLVKFTVTDSP